MKAAGMLDSSTDVTALTKKAFAQLGGVSDEWLQTLQVNEVANRQLPPDEIYRVRAELAADSKTPDLVSCCSPGGD
jgi:hypothetical protein